MYQNGMVQPMQNSYPTQGYGTGMPQPSNLPPQTPVMAPMGMGQGNYTPGPQMGVRVRPVASYDEAKAVPTDFMGNTLILTDLSHGFIYTKMLDTATGSSIFHVYQRIPDQAVQVTPTSTPMPDPVPAYDAKSEIDAIRAELNSIKHELGLDKEEAK